MLIDNKTDIYHDGQIQTVWKYLLDHVKQGDLDIVSGFFSIAGLHALYTELNPDVKYRLIFSEMTRDDDFMNKVLNLLQGDSSIETALQLVISSGIKRAPVKTASLLQAAATSPKLGWASSLPATLS